jgi:hypothetical protein
MRKAEIINATLYAMRPGRDALEENAVRVTQMSMKTLSSRLAMSACRRRCPSLRGPESSSR